MRALWMLAVLTAPLAAQADPVCQQTAEKFPAAKDSSNYPALVGTIAACGPTFAHVLVNEWAIPPADTVSLRALTIATTRARSPEIFEAVMRVLRDNHAALAVRIAAMEATPGWVNPCMEIRLRGVASDKHAHITAATSIRPECDQGYGPTGPNTKEAKELIKTLDRTRSVSGDNLAISTAASATATTLKMLGRTRP
ncbi:MAG TPA: hypothetical protein VFN22_00825 [Gemmatimonadales bacterium]|nr:hypothetical protein [Gemmatimonadales bacterium]